MTNMVVPKPQRTEKQSWTAWLRDERFLQVLAQVVFVGIVALVAYLLFQNMARALARQGIQLGFSFLQQVAGFDIKEAVIPHTRASTNLNAIAVAVINTILVSVISIILSTILGVIVGIARISNNYLANRVAWLYIEIFRNIPLLLVIIATYSVVIYNLPNVNESFAISESIFINNRGIYLPRPVATSMASTFWLMLAACLVLAILAAVIISRKYRLDSFLGGLVILGIFIPLALVAWFVLPQAAYTLDFPAKTGLNFKGGFEISPEFAAMVLGLVLGSSPFTADMVRAGIQQVSKGQIEAARALGMSGYQTMRLIIFPQALRVIIPPMTSNYLSLTKNSSLATAIAYPEVVHVSSTITSQTGRAVEMMATVMAIYLTLSLITSAFMNWYNARVRIVER